MTLVSISSSSKLLLNPSRLHYYSSG